MGEMENRKNDGFISYELQEFKVFEPPLFRWARKKSLWIVAFCTGCGGIEMPPLATARYDFERFGIMPNPAPRMADLFLITGYVTPKTLKRIIITYEMMQDPPKYVLAHGSCPINGGVYWDSYNVVKQLDKYIPVDVVIAGCMPRPEAVMDGITEIMRKIEDGTLTGGRGTGRTTSGIGRTRTSSLEKAGVRGKPGGGWHGYEREAEGRGEG